MIEDERRKAFGVACRAEGISSMTCNSLVGHANRTGDERFIDLDALATMSAKDLRAVRQLGKIGIRKMQDCLVDRLNHDRIRRARAVIAATSQPQTVWLVYVQSAGRIVHIVGLFTTEALAEEWIALQGVDRLYDFGPIPVWNTLPPPSERADV